ncbi:MAG: hypothetical protein L3J75_03895 [Methylococcaceae bacterium]|nr:hypothetical protein [Methylococcaceae bacterium]
MIPIDLLAVTLILFGTLLILASNRFPADTVLLGSLCLLTISGILTPVEALAGLANPGIATIAVLYVVVSGLRETGAIAWLSRLLLGKPNNMTFAQIRLLIPAATFSVFINNSPVVAMFTNT